MRAVRTVSTLVFLSCIGFGQSVTSRPTFDVASIKPSRHVVGKDANSQVSIRPAGLSGKNVTLKHLIIQAYRLQPYQVFGGPNWLDLNEYDIDAKADGPATKEQIVLMLRTLLTDRFRLSLHSEAKELRVYELVTDKNGPKIQAMKDAETPAAKTGAAGLRSFRGDMQQFANLLSVQLSIPVLDDPGKPGMANGPPVPVLDKTGLQGIYDISADIKPETGVDMFTLWQRALQDQLGLKLESRKANIEGFVVERAERIPIPN